MLLKESILKNIAHFCCIKGIMPTVYLEALLVKELTHEH